MWAIAGPHSPQNESQGPPDTHNAGQDAVDDGSDLHRSLPGARDITTPAILWNGENFELKDPSAAPHRGVGLGKW